MSAIIIYQSSTGNTRFGVQIIQREFQQAGEACEIAHVKEVDAGSLADFDLIGVASAVYAFQPAHNMQAFLRALPDLQGKGAFVFCSCVAVSAFALRHMAARLAERGARILGGHEMRAEDAWPPIRFGPLILGKGRPTDSDIDAVREFAGTVLERCGEFRRGELTEDVPVPRGSLFLHLVSLPITRRALRWAMLGKYVRKNRCTKCGDCVAVCPTGSVRLDDYPTFAKTCIGCFACINLCPESAIACPMSWGHPLYRGIPAEKAALIE